MEVLFDGAGLMVIMPGGKCDEASCDDAGADSNSGCWLEQRNKIQVNRFHEAPESAVEEFSLTLNFHIVFLHRKFMKTTRIVVAMEFDL